jgi:hypothetical protein
VKTEPSKYGISGAYSVLSRVHVFLIATFFHRSSNVHRIYDNEAPGIHFHSTHCQKLHFDFSPLFAVNDVSVHPNQGELISCDQAGRIKQWDLSENICSHELVGVFPTFASVALRYQTPAGDIPIRSVTLASDGSLLVAGNNKVKLPFNPQCFLLDLAPGKVLCVESERGELKPA